MEVTAQEDNTLMISAETSPLDSKQLARRLTELLQDPERPTVQFVHELLKLAASGRRIHATLSDDLEEIVITVESQLSVSTPLDYQPGHIQRPRQPVVVHLSTKRAGVQLRTACARLATISRKANGDRADLY